MPAAPARPKSRPAPTKPATKAASGSPHPARIARLRECTRSLDLGHILITNPLDVGYLTGFLGGDSYLLVAPGKATIVSDFRYQEELGPLKAFCEVYIRKGGMTQAVAEVVAGIDRLGIQADYLTIAERDAIARSINDDAGSRLVSTVGVVAKMRAIKDDHEVELIRKAIKIQEAALKAVLPMIRAGQTEIEVAAQLEAEMKTRGSSQPGFQSIIAAKTNGSLPHYRPSPKVKIARNQPLLIDWGAIWLGYHGDMTRTFALGKWPAKVREIYEIVLDAQMMAADALAPGKSTRDIDAIARDHITRYGYGEAFGHGLGHGLGLNGHEDPRLTHMLPASELKVGQVVTVEPGIYLPGVGGVRIEDDYLITPDGAKNLCSLPKTLSWATLD
jgi:Xaa-Pro aminopeptidase